MKNRLAGALAASLVVLLAAGCAARQEGTATPADAWQQAAQSALDDALRTTGIPGGAITVTHGDTTWTGVAGLADVASGRKVSVDDRFAYRSITKSYTVTAILQLVDEGRLSLDDPVSKYVDGVPEGDRITLRDLARMRSGLPNYSATPAFQDALRIDLTRDWTDAEILQAAFSEPNDFAPDERYEYSNTNTILLGEVLQKVTGKPWYEVVQEAILTPRGLSTATYPDSDPIPSPLAEPYQAAGEGQDPELIPAIPANSLSAAGGFAGTIRDLGRWARILGTGELLAEKTAEQRTSEASLSPTTDDPNSPFYDAYGMGMGEIDGWIGHTGNGLGYQALAMYDPATGDSVAIVLNGTGDDHDAPAHLFQKLLPALS
ncbi:beta-lactamase [Leifsonia sp. LS1]|uniref:serine hydrolase domain-containing protein n=1 Tax=Leifsonia sp. LS1 TaxID=2828483 RepID=UPI001CFE3C2F|nr:serine hydrolase domain-containing protein [Leifsonia sp. LS1]GIT79477.1 beta-lactamase [Leifsonia sp. LS1]